MITILYIEVLILLGVVLIGYYRETLEYLAGRSRSFLAFWLIVLLLLSVNLPGFLGLLFASMFFFVAEFSYLSMFHVRTLRLIGCELERKGAKIFIDDVNIAHWPLVP